MWRSKLAPELVKRLAKTDVQKALEYTATLTGSAQDDGYSNLLDEWIKTNPKGAIEWGISNSEKLGKRSNSLAYLASIWATNDPEEAVQFTKDLPTGEARDRMLNGCIAAMAHSNPEAAAKLIDQFPKVSQIKSVETLARLWARSEPDAAAKWVLSLADADLRHRASGRLIEDWWNYTHNQGEVIAWATGLSDPQLRDSVTSRLTDFLKKYDPETAMRVAVTVADMKLKKDQIRSVVLTWGERDYAAAKQWLKVSKELADAEKNAILKEMN
jgi:hypothetical protein